MPFRGYYAGIIREDSNYSAVEADLCVCPPVIAKGRSLSLVSRAPCPELVEGEGCRGMPRNVYYLITTYTSTHFTFPTIMQ